jgi:hypothetical protein
MVDFSKHDRGEREVVGVGEQRIHPSLVFMVCWVRDGDNGSGWSSLSRGAWAAAPTKIPSGLVAEARRRWVRGGDGEVEEVQA